MLKAAFKLVRFKNRFLDVMFPNGEAFPNINNDILIEKLYDLVDEFNFRPKHEKECILNGRDVSVEAEAHRRRLSAIAIASDPAAAREIFANYDFGEEDDNNT